MNLEMSLHQTPTRRPSREVVATTNGHDQPTNDADPVDVATVRDRHRNATGFDGPLPQVAFAAEPATAEELARLLVIGIEPATTSVLAAY